MHPIDFIKAMHKYVPGDLRVMLAQFRGSPHDDIPGKWRTRPLVRESQIDQKANVYFTVSAMKKNERGEYRRRKDNVAGGILLMIDDLGSGPGAKHPLSTINALEPTALIETSPDNYQAIYMFDELVTNLELFDSLIRAFITRKFLGADTGMAGINRVFRPPYGINGKKEYGGWTVELREWREEARYSVQEIAEAFGLDLRPKGREKPRGATVDKSDAIRRFVAVRSALRSAGMLKRDDSDKAGWTEIVCPWTDNHSARANTGAAIREPHPDNGFVGAFRCHHASCEGKGWRELTDWLSEEEAAILSSTNANAKPFEHYRSEP